MEKEEESEEKLFAKMRWDEWAVEGYREENDMDAVKEDIIDFWIGTINYNLKKATSMDCNKRE